MSFPKYPAYKDSGVQWLGEVPEHWGVNRLSTVATCNDKVLSESTEKTHEIEYLEISGVAAGRGIVATSLMRFGNAPSRARRIVRDGDVLISTVRTYLRAITQVASPPENMIASTGFAVLRPKKVVSRYLGYVFHSDGLVGEVISRSVGVSYPAINASDIGRLFIPLPGTQEQIAIATFLDRETAKIDALVAEQEKLVALLREKRQSVISHAVTQGLDTSVPMKDSGVEWLGKVPAHWEILRIASIFVEVAEIGHEDLPILSVSIHSGVSDTELNEAEMDRKVTRSDDRTKYKAVAPGDLTYNMMRAWQGGFGAVLVTGQVSPAYVVARPSRKIETSFVEQLLRTPKAIEQMRRFSRGITDFRLRLYWEEFKNLRIALPTYDEQLAILDSNQAQMDQFDALTAEAQSAITLLQERRTALISAAVTGQIDVRKQPL